MTGWPSPDAPVIVQARPFFDAQGVVAVQVRRINQSF